jgi:hypothetical protein
MPRSSAVKSQHNNTAPNSRSQEQKASAQQPETSVHHQEPEDPNVAGTSQSQRGVLGQNADAGQNQQHPETPAGQHATGSFTGKPAETNSGKKS